VAPTCLLADATRSGRTAASVTDVNSLAEGLGYGPKDRLLIISSDLLGSTHAATAGCLAATREGMATTATLMMPGPWARHAAEKIRPDDDIGIHLTLNSELDCFRWGPLTYAPSLLDGDGGFPRTLPDLWDHADLDEVRRELTAQLERALLWGFDLTHITTHMGALQQRPEFFDVMLDIAIEARLPLRLETAEAEKAAGFPFRRLAAEEGILFPDHFTLVRAGARRHFMSTLHHLKPGVTEIVFEPAIAAEELRAVDPSATQRVDDLTLVTDRRLGDLIEDAGATMIGYSVIRDLQRSAG